MRELTDQERARREKLNTLNATGATAYPARLGSDRTRIAEIKRTFTELASSEKKVSLAGRIRAVRLHGQSYFADLDDGSGRIQCYLMHDELGDGYDQLINSVDLGDFLELTGSAFTTKRGEQSIKAVSARLIAKALRPLPEKWHGLSDVEIRYRHRELDLIVNEGVKNTLIMRGKITDSIRAFLASEEFLEVETPILQPIPGGATARPFVTHHNSLDSDFYLRIAPELYLKRLVIGGLEKVFEFARCFRNEGIDHLHNPEFTEVELYAAYTDYNWMMNLTERLLRHIAMAVHGQPSFSYEGQTIQLPEHFPQISFRDIILKYGGPDIEQTTDDKKLAQAAKKLNVKISPKDHRASIIDGIFKTVVRPNIIQPIFVIDHPIELSPLAKKKESDPRYTERFQLLIAGSEMCNAFSELNDPIDQRQRFEAQEKLRQGGDEEAQPIDENFLEAMEYGMPPTSGLGLGIDRLTMLLTDNHSIKEVIAFPTLKPARPAAESKTPATLTGQPSDTATTGMLTRQEAQTILTDHVKNKNLQKHMLAVEAVMRYYAGQFKGDPDEWGIVGLLHDFDWEIHPTAEEHPVKGELILAQRGVPEKIRRAILAHAPHTGVKPETPMEKAAFACDEITGLIVAVALVTPSKKLADVTVERVLKKMNQKAFAANVNRDEIREGAELLNLPVEQHIQNALTAMQGIHDDLDL